MGVGAPYRNRNAEKWHESLNITTEFNNEKEYQSYIEYNIKMFCNEVLSLGKYISHSSNKAIEKQNFGKQKQRVDLYIVGENKSAIIELKYPKNYFSEMRNGISQLLYYGSLAKRHGLKYDKLFLVSPVFDNRLFNMIIDYKLPIELVYLTKTRNSKLTIE